MASLGEKIRYFRKKTGQSQLEVEVATGMSAGSLSRIEGNENNPTKETILKLGEVLKLNHMEVSYILSTDSGKVTDDDVVAALKSVKAHMDNARFVCYLLDNRRLIRYVGEMTRVKAKKYGLELEKLYGYSILEAIFSNELPVRKLIPVNNFEKIALRSIKSFRHEYKHIIELGELEDYLRRLGMYPGFNHLWNVAVKQDQEIDLYEDRSFEINLLGTIAKFDYSTIPVDQDTRFEVVEFQPSNLFAKLLFKTV